MALQPASSPANWFGKPAPTGDRWWFVLALAFVIPPLIHPYPFLADDALFNTQVASYIVKLGSSTFNGGITYTNGYHPLWMLFSIAALWISHGSRVAGLRIVIGCAGLFLAASVVLYRRLTRALALDAIVGQGLLIALLGTGLWAMESHLSAFFIVLSMLAARRAASEPSARNQILLGISLGFMMLARLDNLFLALAIVTINSWSGTRLLRRLISAGASTGLAASAVVIPYLLFNYYTYGHVVPVTGALKTTFPHLARHPGLLGSMGKLTAVTALLALLTSLVSWRGGRQRAGVWRLVAEGSLGTLLHAAYILFFSRDISSGFYWYYVMGWINLALTIDVVTDAVRRAAPAGQTRLLARGLAGLLAAMVLFSAFRAAAKVVGININPFNTHPIVRIAGADGQVYSLTLAAWLQTNLPLGSVVLTWDWPGWLAFGTDLRVVPLDGLMNDYAYNDDLMRDGLATFLARNQINYIVAPIEPLGFSHAWPGLTVDGVAGGERVEIFAPLYDRPVGGLFLSQGQMLLRVQDLCPRCWPIAVWRLADGAGPKP